MNEWMNVVNRHFRSNHVSNRLIHPMNHLCQSVGDSASSHSDVTHFRSWTIILPPVCVLDSPSHPSAPDSRTSRDDTTGASSNCSTDPHPGFHQQLILFCHPATTTAVLHFSTAIVVVRGCWNYFQGSNMIWIAEISLITKWWNHYSNVLFQFYKWVCYRSWILPFSSWHLPTSAR